MESITEKPFFVIVDGRKILTLDDYDRFNRCIPNLMKLIIIRAQRVTDILNFTGCPTIKF